jgi:hypothetical protein
LLNNNYTNNSVLFFALSPVLVNSHNNKGFILVNNYKINNDERLNYSTYNSENKYFNLKETISMRDFKDLNSSVYKIYDNIFIPSEVDDIDYSSYYLDPFFKENYIAKIDNIDEIENIFVNNLTHIIEDMHILGEKGEYKLFFISKDKLKNGFADNLSNYTKNLTDISNDIINNPDYTVKLYNDSGLILNSNISVWYSNYELNNLYAMAGNIKNELLKRIDFINNNISNILSDSENENELNNNSEITLIIYIDFDKMNELKSRYLKKLIKKQNIISSPQTLAVYPDLKTKLFNLKIDNSNQFLELNRSKGIYKIFDNFSIPTDILNYPFEMDLYEKYLFENKNIYIKYISEILSDLYQSIENSEYPLNFNLLFLNKEGLAMLTALEYDIENWMKVPYFLFKNDPNNHLAISGLYKTTGIVAGYTFQENNLGDLDKLPYIINNNILNRLDIINNNINKDDEKILQMIYSS